jgi:Tol biopolymer transport system component
MIDETLSHFKITAKLGEGGMGEVYRAADTKLGRDVAIKVLPQAVSDDPERLARFEREAKVLASLNNPNIAAIYGLEEADGQRFLVLELVEGPTLAERIAEGPMTVEEALPIALQIAKALEAAHEAGVVHRDLKPANVVLRDGNQVKVLDFGLAKALETAAAASGSDPSLSLSPTLTQQMTGAGMILGTAGYMAPEQAKGKTADRRADIWSFGIVLFEMLTGRKTFRGETISETLAAVMMQDVDWERLGPEIPVPIERLMQRCLQKEPENRLQAIGDARIALEEFLADPEASIAAVSAPPAAEISTWKRVLPWALVAGLIVLLALQTWVPGTGRQSAVSTKPVRLQARLAPDTPLWSANGASAVLSPDGTRLAYISQVEGNRHLFIRNLDQLEPNRVSGSEGAYNPFFSPDGEWIAFFTLEALKKVSVFGGTPLTLAEVTQNRGGAWGTDGTIIFAQNPNSGLMRIPDTGGVPEPLTELDKESGETTHRWPSFLPDSQAVIFTAHESAASFEDARIEVLDLQTMDRKVLHRGASPARYVSTGHIVYVREGTLYALPFDSKRFEATGPPSPLIENVTTHPQHGSAEFSFSDSGTLVYLTGDGSSGTRSLVFVERSGDVEAISDAVGNYFHPSVSPNGRNLAYCAGEGSETDVWVHDLERGVATRLTFTDEEDFTPVWSPDSQSIAYSSAHESPGNIYVKPADGSGEPERLTENDSFQGVASWSPDGNHLMIMQLSGTQGWDLFTLDLQSGSSPEPFLVTEFHEWNGIFSPDGRWVAYTSTESGTPEIYVRPFPGPGGKWQISKGGGSTPQWSGDGRELFYLAGSTVMAVEVDGTAGAIRAGSPAPLFDGPFESDSNAMPLVFNAQENRFVMLQTQDLASEGPDRTLVTFVFNWFETLKELGPG